MVPDLSSSWRSTAMNSPRKPVIVAFASVGMLLSQACADIPQGPPPTGVPQGAPAKNPTVVITLPVPTPAVTPQPPAPPPPPTQTPPPPTPVPPTPVPPTPIPPTPTPPSSVPNIPPVGVDPKERRITGIGKSLPFTQGEPVAGSVITLSNGQTFYECSFYGGAPMDGTVFSGVIYPGWGDRRVPPCS